MELRCSTFCVEHDICWDSVVQLESQELEQSRMISVSLAIPFEQKNRPSFTLVDQKSCESTDSTISQPAIPVFDLKQVV